MSRFKEYIDKNYTWDSVEARYRDYENTPYRPASPYLQDGTVVDSSQSVDWNREFVRKNQEAWKKARKDLEKKRAAILRDCTEMVKFMMWEILDHKLSDNDIDRYYETYRDHYMSDGFGYMCAMIQQELNEIQDMDWFKSLPAK